MARLEIEGKQQGAVLILLFDKGLQFEEAKAGICETYGYDLKISKCRWRYNKFENGDRK